MAKNITPDSTLDAMETLVLIKEGYYNMDRLSNIIIKELVDVIKYLNEKIDKQLEVK